MCLGINLGADKAGNQLKRNYMDDTTVRGVDDLIKEVHIHAL